MADARNKALEIAEGEYAIQLDLDDWVELNCLEEMYAMAKKNNADMLICDYYHNIAKHMGNRLLLHWITGLC